MKNQWHLLYCDQSFDLCPIAEFIDACRPNHQIKIIRFLTLLEQHGPTLPRPYADILHDGIHELRITLSGDQIRLLYFFCHRKFIVLYDAFIKNTQRVPEKFIQNVALYRKEFMGRLTRDDLEELIRANL